MNYFFYSISGYFLLTVFLLFLWSKCGVRDSPSERSSHVNAVVTSSGVCFTLPYIILSIYGYLFDDYKLSQLESIFLFGLSTLSLIGFIDDKKEISYKIRLASHMLVVSVLLIPFNFSFLLNLILILTGIALINFCNFLDGINGFLASQWLLSVGFLLNIFFPHDIHFWCLWSGVFAFLLFNFPKAKLFMGDSGSTVLGYIYYCITLQIINTDGKFFPNAFFEFDMVIVFCLFPMAFAWGDATCTLLNRIIRKKSILLSFRDYGFHRLSLFFNNQSAATLSYLCGNLLLCSFIYMLTCSYSYIYWVMCAYIIMQFIISYVLFFRLR